jgi:hypothetical protein
MEEIAKHQSTIIICCRAPPRLLEHGFIHELIHHIQFSQNVALRSKTEPLEDEVIMLEIARQFIAKSWIPKRFEETLQRSFDS